MKIFKQIPLIMADVGSIAKSRDNKQQGYKFRGIDDLYLALQGPLQKHGVFFAPNVIEHNREERPSKSGGVLIYTVLKINYKFYADDGSFFDVTTVGEAMDSGDKSANKAMSSALKYALLEVFCIPTEEEKDTEYQNPDPLPKSNPHAVKNMQPAANDGHPPDSNYRIPFGKYIRKSLDELYFDPSVGISGISGYIRYLENNSATTGKPLGKEALEFIKNAEKFLGAMENNSDPFL